MHYNVIVGVSDPEASETFYNGEVTTLRIAMNYGRTGLPIDLPDDWPIDIIRKPPMPVPSDAPGEIARALAEPIGSGTLADIAKGRHSACILICDITRPVPNSLFLPALVAEIVKGGIGASAITILVATGMHRPNEGDEQDELIGCDLPGGVRVVNHFARSDGAHAQIGTTTFGIPVRLDRRFLEADLRIVTGLVEPHFMAGYSGGRKLLAPGIAHQDTITMLHSAGLLDHPLATNCVLDGNPVHAQMLEIVEMAGECLALNTVLDDERRLTYATFGEVNASHLAAVEFMRRYAEVSVPCRYKTVVTSAAGYPLDKTYYQTIKGIVGAAGILEPGGDLIIVSECSEGLGSREFAESQRRMIELGEDAFLEEIKRKPCASIDEWETQMQLKVTRMASVGLYSGGLSERDWALTGVERVTDPAAAIAASVRATGDARLAAIPEGPYVIPCCFA